MQATPASVESFDFSVGMTYQFVTANYHTTRQILETDKQDKIVLSGSFSDDYDWDAASEEDDEDVATQQDNDSAILQNEDANTKSHRNHKFICTAKFHWRSYEATFVCFYEPYRNRYFDFQLARYPFGRKKAEEQRAVWPWCMNQAIKDDLGPGAIKIQQFVKVPPLYLDGKASKEEQVKDDAGRKMISARLDVGGSNALWLWGKEVKEGEQFSMSEGEKFRIARFQHLVERDGLLDGGLQNLGVYESGGV